jgi:hypothetical protein
MSASSEIDQAAAGQPSSKCSFLVPAALALGGALSVVWTCALGLCTYELVCWLFA